MSTPNKTHPAQHIGGTILVVMMEVDPAHEDEFNRWYNDEHLPERQSKEPASPPRPWGKHRRQLTHIQDGGHAIIHASSWESLHTMGSMGGIPAPGPNQMLTQTIYSVLDPEA